MNDISTRPVHHKARNIKAPSGGTKTTIPGTHKAYNCSLHPLEHHHAVHVWEAFTDNLEPRSLIINVLTSLDVHLSLHNWSLHLSNN